MSFFKGNFCKNDFLKKHFFGNTELVTSLSDSVLRVQDGDFQKSGGFSLEKSQRKFVRREE
jgi:hypothetical protein